MLTYEGCLALCERTEQEVEAIAEHEHIPEIAAAEMGNYLVRGHEGTVGIRLLIRDDICAAQQRGDLVHAAKLKLVLRHFVECHRRDFEE
ncbi:MAG: hypothetical protein GY789_17255 [Hyphomicrobiales bacterium]|nr:hypothetical protein [Hyphomicrobiales bacterium]